jgi:hypothetical protein
LLRSKIVGVMMVVSSHDIERFEPSSCTFPQSVSGREKVPSETHLGHPDDIGLSAIHECSYGIILGVGLGHWESVNVLEYYS